MRIHWHGLEFVGDEGDATYTIETDSLRGVLDGAGVRRDGAPRSQSDGEFTAPGFLTGITGSIGGLVEVDSDYAYERAVNRLKAIPAREESPLTVQSAAGSRWCSAQRVGTVEVRPLVYGRVARYMVEWFAPDPRWFGETEPFTGSSVALLHRGDSDATPTITVTGPRPAYTITGPNGEQFQVNQALTSGQTHLIDMWSGRVYRNGVIQPGVVGAAGTWVVPPGRVVAASISSGEMTVRVADTFVG